MKVERNERSVVFVMWLINVKQLFTWLLWSLWFDLKKYRAFDCSGLVTLIMIFYVVILNFIFPSSIFYFFDTISEDLLLSIINLMCKIMPHLNTLLDGQTSYNIYIPTCLEYHSLDWSCTATQLYVILSSSLYYPFYSH